MSVLSRKSRVVLLRAFLLWLCVSLVLLLLPARVVGPVRDVAFYPFAMAQRAALRLGRTMAGAVGSGGAEARRLREENARLTNALVREQALRRLAEERLAQAAALPPDLRRRAVPAAVVSFDPAPRRFIATLRVGGNSGVAPHSPVLWNGALIGLVKDVGPFTARAVLVGDPECRVAVRNVRSGARGVLEGLGGNRCRVKYVDLSADVAEGDVFVSSEADPHVPAGHAVARCLSVRTEDGEVFKRIEAAPFFSAADLDSVMALAGGPAPAAKPRGSR